MNDSSLTQSANHPAGEDLVRTTLIHRRVAASTPWWRTASVSEIPGVCDVESLRMLTTCTSAIAQIGFTAVLLRPALVSLAEHAEVLTAAINAAHRVGLRVLVRLSGADYQPWTAAAEPPSFFGLEGDTAQLVVRARLALKCGADGIDLGRIEDAVEAEDAARRAEKFSVLTRLLMAELADFSEDHILAAEATVMNEAAFSRHPTEEWFHHLRDDRLARVPFDAASIGQAVSLTLTQYDQVGATTAWKALIPRLVGTPGIAHAYSGSWEEGADESRRAAMRLVLCGLPGAVYLPYGFCGGHVDFADTAARPSPPTSCAELERARHTTLALRIRAERSLAKATYAHVTGMPWQRPGVLVSVSGTVMTVINTTSQPVRVPADYELLLRSDSARPEANPAVSVSAAAGLAHWTITQGAQPTDLGPMSAAWFIPHSVPTGMS